MQVYTIGVALATRLHGLAFHGSGPRSVQEQLLCWSASSGSDTAKTGNRGEAEDLRSLVSHLQYAIIMDIFMPFPTCLRTSSMVERSSGWTSSQALVGFLDGPCSR